jgi:hypothetical protein
MKEELTLLHTFHFYGCLNITTHKTCVCMDAEFEKLARTSIMNSPAGYSNMVYVPCINLIQNI